MRKELMFLAVAVLTAATEAQGEVFSVPKSNTLISVELTLPDGQTAQVQVRDGSMISVQDESTGDGYMYAFVSSVDKGAQQTYFTPLSISDIGNGRQRASYIGDDSAIALNGLDEIETPHGRFGFHIKELATATFPVPLVDPRSTSPSTLKKLFGRSGGGTCCVSCGMITVCGDSVILRCGSCDGGAMTY